MEYDKEWYIKIAELTDEDYFSVNSQEVLAAAELLRDMGFSVYKEAAYPNEWVTCYGVMHDFDLKCFCFREMEKIR